MTFLRPRDVTKRLGFSRAYLYALMAEGRFPRPTKLSARVAVWPVETIDAWAKAQVAEAAQ
ncbi:MAG: AlpA family phage regulatory protein [Amaricoccus sp.]